MSSLEENIKFLLKEYGKEELENILKEICLVQKVTIIDNSTSHNKITCSKTENKKCLRCYKFDIDKNSEEEICIRCNGVLEKIVKDCGS